ncbi:HU family DNA-binding protein [soil metagenome]
MNKTELIEAVAVELKGTKAEAARLVDTVLTCITTGLKSEDKVAISGFGTFVKRKRPARKGISPITKEVIEIKPSTSCGFRASQSLREVI